MLLPLLLLASLLALPGRTPLFARPAGGTGSWRAARGAARTGLRARGEVERASSSLLRVGPADVATGQAQRALYLLGSEPALFEAAVEEELRRLEAQRNLETTAPPADPSPFPDKDALVLRQRVLEVKSRDRARVATELLYLKVCGAFLELGVPLSPSLREGGAVNLGSWNLASLTSGLYSKEALELLREHLLRVIGSPQSMSRTTVVHIALFQASQVYAMSALFGYYLRRVEARFRLEKLVSGTDLADDVVEEFASLKDYVSAFGPDEVQRMTSFVSVEAQLALERQVVALFGDLRLLKQGFIEALGPAGSAEEATQRLQNAVLGQEVESLRITGDHLQRLVLEAVAFGAFLNDCEQQVDSLYRLTPSSTRRSALLAGDDDEDALDSSRLLLD